MPPASLPARFRSPLRALAWLQIATGAIGLLAVGASLLRVGQLGLFSTLLSWTSQEVHTNAAEMAAMLLVLAGFYVLAITAGYKLLSLSRVGGTLSLIVQVLQVPVAHTSLVSWTAYLGGSVYAALEWCPAPSRFDVGVLFGTQARLTFYADAPCATFGVNLLALLVSVLLYRLLEPRTPR